MKEDPGVAVLLPGDLAERWRGSSAAGQQQEIAGHSRRLFPPALFYPILKKKPYKPLMHPSIEIGAKTRKWCNAIPAIYMAPLQVTQHPVREKREPIMYLS